MKTLALSLDARMVLTALVQDKRATFTYQQATSATRRNIDLKPNQIDHALDELEQAGKIRYMTPSQFELVS